MPRLATATPSPRPLQRSIVGILLGALLLSLGSVGIAAAQDTTDEQDGGDGEDNGLVAVLEINGLLDPVLADFIDKSLTEAEELAQSRRVLAVVLQVDSPGAVIDDEAFAELSARIASSPVPVMAWVGPSGSEMRGATAQLGASLDVIGLSPNSSLGELGPTLVDSAALDAAYGGQVARIRDRSIGYDDLPDSTLVDAEPTYGIVTQAITIGEFLINLDGFESVQVPDENDPSIIRLQPISQVVFNAPNLLDQTFHSMASPAVAYLLFIIGLALLLFEFYTAGVGVAGVIGAGFFLGGAYGLSVLPTRWWAIALIVGSVIGYGVDVQTGVPRFWTFASTLMFIIGSWVLYDGVSLPWLTLVVGIIGMLTAMINGMPAMVRTRFSTPTIGREWMVGEVGEALEDISPEGTVKLRDAIWRARTNRATPIAAGEQLEVVEIDGLLLEVAPLVGAAEDYRERAKARRAGTDDVGEAEEKPST